MVVLYIKKYYQYTNITYIKTSRCSQLYQSSSTNITTVKWLIHGSKHHKDKSPSLKERYTMIIDCVISYINLIKVISFCHHGTVKPSHDRASSPLLDLFVFIDEKLGMSLVPIAEMCPNQIWRNKLYPTGIPKTAQLKRVLGIDSSRRTSNEYMLQ